MANINFRVGRISWLGREGANKPHFYSGLNHCDQSMSDIHRQQLALNYILSETARPKDSIFGMKHCLVVFYHDCSNGGSRVQNGFVEGGVLDPTRIPRIAVSRLPALFHKIEVNL